MIARLPVVAVMALLAAVFAPGAASAQLGAEEPGAAELALLDHEDYGVRERAVRRLVQSPAFDLRTVERLLGSPEQLTPEQRAQVRRVGYEMFRARDRAGLGVGFGGSDRNGVRLSQVIENFDMFRIAEAGDVLVAIDGRPVTSDAEVRVEIISRLPGETMRVELRRRLANGETRTIEDDVTLGSLSALRQAQVPDDSLMRRAWSQRLARRVGESRAPAIGSGIGGRAWLEAEGRWDGEANPRTGWPSVPAFSLFRISGQADHAAISAALIYADRIQLDRRLARGWLNIEPGLEDRLPPVDRLRQAVELVRLTAREADRLLGSNNEAQREKAPAMMAELEEAKALLESVESAIASPAEDGG
ncbi:MAG: hypothetical protein AAFR38_00755 [Planctomycetota bacterium]